LKKINITLVFEENADFFRPKWAKIGANWRKSSKIGEHWRKLAKIAQIVDQNIDPRPTNVRHT
jgi:hypothetical protein